MKFYSEKLRKLYDTEAELKTAEKAYEEEHAEELKLKEEKKKRAEEIRELEKKVIEMKSAFIKDYGSWHSTYTSEDFPTVKNWFDWWF